MASKDIALDMCRNMASVLTDISEETKKTDYDLLDSMSDFINKVQDDYDLSDDEVWSNCN